MNWDYNEDGECGKFLQVHNKFLNFFFLHTLTKLWRKYDFQVNQKISREIKKTIGVLPISITIICIIEPRNSKIKERNTSKFNILIKQWILEMNLFIIKKFQMFFSLSTQSCCFLYPVYCFSSLELRICISYHSFDYSRP